MLSNHLEYLVKTNNVSPINWRYHGYSRSVTLLPSVNYHNQMFLENKKAFCEQ